MSSAWTMRATLGSLPASHHLAVADAPRVPETAQVWLLFLLSVLVWCHSPAVKSLAQGHKDLE